MAMTREIDVTRSALFLPSMFKPHVTAPSMSKADALLAPLRDHMGFAITSETFCLPIPKKRIQPTTTPKVSIRAMM